MFLRTILVLHSIAILQYTPFGQSHIMVVKISFRPNSCLGNYLFLVVWGSKLQFLAPAFRHGYPT